MGKHVALPKRPQRSGAGSGWRAGDGGPDHPHRELHPRASLLRRTGERGTFSPSDV